MTEGFALLFDQLLRTHRFSVRDFAQRSGLAWSFIHRVRTGDRIPPLERLEAWADIFALTGRERQRFLDLAHWSHVPPDIRTWLNPRLKRPIDEPAP